jgi:hypothetical protein
MGNSARAFDRGLVRSLALSCIGSVGLSGAAQAEEEHGEELSPHHLSVIVAGTVDDDEEAFTLGLDYEYRVNELLGVGAIAEYVFEDLDAWTLLGVADIHVWRGFAIQTGPGVEFIDGDGEEQDEEEFVYRIGALYEFEIDRFTVSPQVHYDITTGKDAVVFGFAFGVNF